MTTKLKVIIDFDGTLTAEETQTRSLASRSLDTLANEIVRVPRPQLAAEYEATRTRILAEPHHHWWEVNGLVASYCDEGAFILNTTTLQVMLRDNPAYAQAVAAAFPQAEYDAVVDCTNYLFHRHTAELAPAFRPAARGVLSTLAADPARIPIILTNSLSDKVRGQLATLALDTEIAVLGDTRQYDMDPNWRHRFVHPELGPIQVWPVGAEPRPRRPAGLKGACGSLCGSENVGLEERHIDLRRPVYYRALRQAAGDGSQLLVVADTFSLPGALPLLMGIPFYLLRTAYTPDWCVRTVRSHPLGKILEELGELPAALNAFQAV